MQVSLISSIFLLDALLQEAILPRKHHYSVNLPSCIVTKAYLISTLISSNHSYAQKQLNQQEAEQSFCPHQFLTVSVISIS